MRKSVYLAAVLSILASYLMYEVIVYESLIPVLLWSNATLNFNVIANRNGWRACKRFRWCDLNHPVPQWQIIWRGEAAFIA